MEFINPIGRSYGDGAVIQACKCHDGYAGYRGNNDSCIHCGCGCGDSGEYRTGNRVNSTKTIRASQL